jgi:hypothetical protein
MGWRRGRVRGPAALAPPPAASTLYGAMTREEEVLPFPAPRKELVAQATLVRGTWVAASLRGVRQHGFEDAYLAKLDPQHAPAIINSAYLDWLPIEVLGAHYAACDTLALPSFQLVALGTEATRYAQGAVVGMVAKLARASAEVTPWPVLSQLQRLWDRAIVGGGISVTKLGPREARVEVAGFAGCRYRHCRIGLRGVLTGVTEMFCAKAHVSELPGFGEDSGGMRIAWV